MILNVKVLNSQGHQKLWSGSEVEDLDMIRAAIRLLHEESDAILFMDEAEMLIVQVSFNGMTICTEIQETPV